MKARSTSPHQYHHQDISSYLPNNIVNLCNTVNAESQLELCASCNTSFSILLPALTTSKSLALPQAFIHIHSAMFILIPGRSNNRVETAASHSDKHFMKRDIEVNSTLSTVIAMVYLALWVIGMGLCIFYCNRRPNRQSLQSRMPWRGEKKMGKQPEGAAHKSDNSRSSFQRNSRMSGTIPEAGPSDAGVGNEWGPSRGYRRSNPWVDLHYDKDRYGREAPPHEVDITSRPMGHLFLPRIDEESMSTRIPSADSQVASHGSHSAKPRLRINSISLNIITTEIIQASNHAPVAEPESRLDHSPGGLSPSWGRVPEEANRLPIHSPLSATTSTMSSPWTEESSVSRRIVTPSPDDFPLPPSSSESRYTDPSPFLATNPRSPKLSSNTPNVFSPPSYPTGDTAAQPIRHAQERPVEAGVFTMPVYSNWRASHQARMRSLSNATSESSVGTLSTVTSQPVVATVQQARRVSMLGPAPAIAVPYDIDHLNVPRAV
ncbi:hypothetical protein P691DRAFT_299205 [Macrolepiota fuliginosa MF-IS2]|uniref:Uncharacterized protein n=1 Tax=Macrolepiota fuliginosa MF-IS2 TaxID=1400762 RepID=A0A9P5X4Y1_9AGAR|nr:hypothetical protein P691DRAFT_299205 [Macrolepiota fuliginosa MF-IS2]